MKKLKILQSKEIRSLEADVNGFIADKADNIIQVTFTTTNDVSHMLMVYTAYILYEEEVKGSQKQQETLTIGDLV